MDTVVSAVFETSGDGESELQKEPSALLDGEEVKDSNWDWNADIEEDCEINEVSEYIDDIDIEKTGDCVKDNEGYEEGLRKSLTDVMDV